VGGSVWDIRKLQSRSSVQSSTTLTANTHNQHNSIANNHGPRKRRNPPLHQQRGTHPALLPFGELRLIIYQFVPSIAGKTFQLVNPATEEPTYTVHEAEKEDIDLAVKYAKQAQPAWEALNSILPRSNHSSQGVANVHLKALSVRQP
jgi:hypothetical protein